MNARCPYGFGKPLWLTLSSFHPPITRVAADCWVVEFLNMRHYVTRDFDLIIILYGLHYFCTLSFPVEEFLAGETNSARFCEKQGEEAGLENSITCGLKETGCFFFLYFILRGVKI